MNAGVAGSGAIGAAVQWLDELVLGTLGSVIAVIAVAAIGLLLLTGRLDARQAGRVIVGCFIIFGASTIAAGVTSVFPGSGSPDQLQAPPPPPPISVTAPGRPPAASPYDPYAGAALPPRK